ncbi:MAG: hypothetical protein N3F67_04595 [Acidilobaceae archaeon]|nr:hypothetical protein [Acidilobaceae archaeon]
MRGSGSKFEGILPEFINVLSGSEGKPQSRYAELLDYVQYNNPPYFQTEMEREIGVPQPSISRFFSVLRERALVRMRLDFIHRMIGLRVVAAVYEGVWLKVAPLMDWVSSVNNTFQGTIVFYRVPEGNVGDLLELLMERPEKPHRVFVLEDHVMAKPSLLHYFAERSHQDPLTAFKDNEDHPKVEQRYLRPYLGETMNIVKDFVDLYILMRGEIDAVSALMETWGALAAHGIQRARRKVFHHVLHIGAAMRGSKAMIYDSSEKNALLYLIFTTSEECSRYINGFFSTYLYTVSIMKGKEGVNALLLSLPLKYIVEVTSRVKGMCALDEIKVYSQLHADTVVRQILPIRNYDHLLKKWDFWNASRLELQRKDMPKYQVNDEFVMEISKEAYLRDLENE